MDSAPAIGGRFLTRSQRPHSHRTTAVSSRPLARRAGPWRLLGGRAAEQLHLGPVAGRLCRDRRDGRDRPHERNEVPRLGADDLGHQFQSDLPTPRLRRAELQIGGQIRGLQLDYRARRCRIFRHIPSDLLPRNSIVTSLCCATRTTPAVTMDCSSQRTVTIVSNACDPVSTAAVGLP